MTTLDVYTERAEAGALALDIDEPGWLDRIDLDRLDLGSSLNCVRGQVYGHYSAGPGAHDFVRMLAQGFTVGVHLRSDETGFWHEVALLTDVWRDLVLNRRAERAVSA